MTTIPTGAPPWLRTNDFTAYGGDLNKKNFASRGVINPKTDVGAEAFSRIAADVAAFARTSPFAVVKLLCRSGGLPPLIEYCALMTGVRTIAYDGNAAPAGFPSGVMNGVGDATLTFDASYTDPFGVIGALALTHANTQLIYATGGVAVPELVTAQQVRVRAFNLTGAAISDARIVIVLGAGG